MEKLMDFRSYIYRAMPPHHSNQSNKIISNTKNQSPEIADLKLKIIIK